MRQILRSMMLSSGMEWHRYEHVLNGLNLSLRSYSIFSITDDLNIADLRTMRKQTR